MRSLFTLAIVTLAVWAGTLPPALAADTSAENPDLVKCGDNIDIKEEGDNICYYNECSVCDLQKLAQNVLNYFVILVVVVAMLVFTNAGVLYATSRGNPGTIGKAHGMFTSALVGLVIVLGAYLLINTLMWALYEGGDFGDWKSFLCHSETNKHCVPKVKTMTLKPSGIEGGPPSGFTCSSYGGQCVIGGVCAEWIKQSPGYWTMRSDSTGCSKKDDICCVPADPSDPSMTCDKLGGTCSKECQANDVRRTKVSGCSDTCCLPEHTGDSCEFEEGSWTLNPKKIQGTCQNEGFCKGSGKKVDACGSKLYCCPKVETPPPAGTFADCAAAKGACQQAACTGGVEVPEKNLTTKCPNAASGATQRCCVSGDACSEAVLKAKYGGAGSVDAPGLQTLISCYTNDSGVREWRDTQSPYTYDRTYPLCNFTNGERTSCTPKCSHSVDSCHYGRGSGKGAMAFDLNGRNESKLCDAAKAAQAKCGGRVLCESNHTHVSLDACGSS